MSIPVDPHLVPAASGHRGVLVWRWDTPTAVLSSAPVGGGLGEIEWVLNVGVPSDYDRTDLSEHAREIAAALGLQEAGIAMFTAVDLGRRQRCEFEEVAVDATVGISHPTWATDPSAASVAAGPGTINLMVQVPVALDPGAAVNAVITATEAKVQALAARRVPGTGTATDAIAVAWPCKGAPERFAGPRSRWGARIAQAVYRAVWAGAELGA